MSRFKWLITIAIAFAWISCKNSDGKPQVTFKVESKGEWKEEFNQKLGILGHRNWIIVADKAFPQQTAPGIEYIDTHGKIAPVLEYVMEEIKKAGHVEPEIYQDRELQYIGEDQSKGIDAFRATISKTLNGKQVQTILHDSVFTKLDRSSKLFKVLVLKTDELLPYTSVFLQLNCAYWNGDNEKKMREKMAAKP
jgi:D-ribose pyranose/furanose isomerase RbsD